MKMFLKKFITVSLTLILIILLFPTISIFKLPGKIYLNESVPSINHIGSSICEVDNNKYEFKLLGILPIKCVEVENISNLKVQVGGIPIGVRVSSDGVIVVGYSEIEINNKKEESPGKTGGLEIGDVIVKINDVEVFNALDLHKIIENSEDGVLNIELIRKNVKMTKTIHCKKENNENYKIGLWVRDSTAGVGTMTFYDSKSRKFGALGHPITDCDTNEPFVIKKGNILDSSIISVKKGRRGNPGELRGVFVNEEEPCGTIDKNTQSGIYGKYAEKPKNSLNKTLPVACRDEIKTGSAKIITTIDENGPREFNVEIEKLNNQKEPDAKSMVIKITDEELLEKTGGIVQGMSGSPIIQNEKLVGAVTHVLINKPDTGYGIYIEWMLQDAGLLK